MSKEIKVIDLLNKIADREELPKKILILDEVYYLINDEDGNIVYSQLKDRRKCEAFIDHQLNITKCLHEDVIILDDETEIIEEQEDIDIQNLNELNIDEIMSLDNDKRIIIALANIRILQQAVKQLDKNIREDIKE